MLKKRQEIWLSYVPRKIAIFGPLQIEMRDLPTLSYTSTNEIPSLSYTWAQLFGGRLVLNPGLNLTRVSISLVQKHFLG